MGMSQNLNNLMQEAQKMQERMQEAQKTLTDLTVTGRAGAGMVEILVDGRHIIKKCKINPTLLNEDVEMLEDLIVAACNDAARQIEKASKEKIAELTAGLNIPTDFLNSEDK